MMEEQKVAEQPNDEIVSLVQTSAQAYIMAKNPADGWINKKTAFASLIHVKSVNDALKVILYDQSEKQVLTFKWNPRRLKSKEDSRYLVLLAREWDAPKGADDVTMTLKFHTDAGAQMWVSISEQMIESLTGLKKRKEKVGLRQKVLSGSASSGPQQRKTSLEDPPKSLEPGFYSIVSAKVDWVSFWTELDESKAHRTLLPVNSIIEVKNVQPSKDSRGHKRIKCLVLELFYPKFSELHDDEVPKKNSSGWIKGNYLAKKTKKEIEAEQELLIDEVKYEAELLVMANALKEINELKGNDRIMLLRAIKVTLQHVIINPYRPRKLKRSNPKHANIFISECGPALLALVGFEADGHDEVFLPSAQAIVSLAKFVLHKIDAMDDDLEKKFKHLETGDMVMKLDVGGSTFTTKLGTLVSVKGSWFEKQFSADPITLQKTEEGGYFIDRDPTHFQTIINYLRDPNKESFKLPENKKDLQNLLKEANFFGLDDMVKLGNASI